MTAIDEIQLPDDLAQNAQAASLPTPQALASLLKDAMRRHAAQTLLAGAARAMTVGSKALSMDQIQAEVVAVREAQAGAAQ